MNKSLLTGLVAGIAVATAGGVAGYAFFSQPSAEEEQGTAVVAEAAQHADHAGAAQAAPQRSAPAQPAPTPVATVREECWDEEVAVEAEPRDRHQIAGTALGAVVGGAVAKDLGDRDLTTAVGAAAGAFIGRKIQQEVQENRAESRTVTTTERRCAPAGSR
ncbi:MAG TPA: glycine zipper 2TM domain-containing protein [Gammaproteobacteria bacterium]